MALLNADRVYYKARKLLRINYKDKEAHDIG